MGFKLMRYTGKSRDLDHNPWLRLVNGRPYEVNVLEMKSGFVRIRIRDGFETERISYKSKEDYEKEWCKWNPKKGETYEE